MIATAENLHVREGQLFDAVSSAFLCFHTGCKARVQTFIKRKKTEWRRQKKEKMKELYLLDSFSLKLRFLFLYNQNFLYHFIE